jgi:hypothetical protein
MIAISAKIVGWCIILLMVILVGRGVLVAKRHSKNSQLPATLKTFKQISINENSGWNPMAKKSGAFWRNLIFGMFVLWMILSFLRVL